MDDATESLLPPSSPDQALDEPSYARRLRGWLTYAFASEVFAVCSLGLFLPICLEQFARDNGVLLPDRTVPCLVGAPSAEAVDGARCVVKIGWSWVDTASFSLYVYSASVAIQALTVISMGGLADHPPHRKPLLLSFAALGSLSATLFLLLPSLSPLWPLCALLAVIANVAFGASIVALNAYLPGLARDAKELREMKERCMRGEEGEGDGEAEWKTAVRDYNDAVSKMTSRISSRGIALGYAAGIVMLLLLLIPVTVLKGTTFSLRLCIGLTGIWWATFTVPTGIWLPGAVAKKEQGDASWSAWREIAGAWAGLGRMLRPREVRKLGNTFAFLGAWFLLSDAFTTISSTAILFAKTALHLPPTSLILIGILAPLAGVLGALSISYLQAKVRWTNLRVLIILVAAVSAVPAYGCLGFLVEGFGGLKTAGEMYGLAVYYGFIMGAFQSYARAVFSELIPRGEEARWFGLYSITDKSSSFFGPLIVGVISDATANIRYAFFFLIFMVVLPIPVLCLLDMDKGREDAEIYSRARTRQQPEGQDI